MGIGAVHFPETCDTDGANVDTARCNNGNSSLTDDLFFGRNGYGLGMGYGLSLDLGNMLCGGGYGGFGGFGCFGGFGMGGFGW